ncbi:CubicO group peptidase (beta-lactamase class C family) [Frigoribacterium sp. PhB160]|uniref:serine hydrolase domain-containing protein n=1 Tax=Frigoribacterium sp. PhB160 TaxID=2485192 RepID=UPI000F48417B|nr:serine hydrolase domain-containing protein [Frigoribacterium sp. PhB160]ROS59529.1 CubicO group peptidase (beta-lactamase class C family) [Frigoribacterium sp. PhB160]
MTHDALPTRAPSDEGVDAAGVLAFVDALEARPDVEPHGLMVLRSGAVLAQGWWAPYSPERPHLLYSLSKSFTATAVGLAVDEGLLGLDDTVLSHVPELDADVADERSRRMRVRDLLAMASGHRDETLDRALAADPDDLVRGFLLTPPDAEPGSVFAYNQPCTYTLAEIVRRVSGTSLVDFLTPRLLEPLGVDAFAWQRDPSGRELGFSGLHSTTDAIAKLGLLYLQRGLWQGRQLLSAAWVDEATREHVANGDDPGSDWAQGYGFQFWMARHGFRGDGAYGQFCVVLPEHGVVVAYTGQTVEMQVVLDLAWEHLLPAFDGPGTTEADARLAERLAGLRLPGVEAPVAGARRTTAVGAAPSPLTGTFATAAGSDQPSLTSVELTADGLVLVDGDDRLEAALGGREWVVTGPLATSAARDGDRLRVDVAFVETPHRLHLVVDPAAGTVTARWQTAPLHGRALRSLRAPGPGEVLAAI